MMVICAAVALLVFGYAFRSREPVYAGKTLSYWVHLYNDAIPGDAEKEQAADAIRKIEDDALPFLLRWLRHEPHLSFTVIDKLVQKTPLKNSQRLDDWMYGSKRAYRADEAIHIFQLLDRPLAKRAIPKLTAYLNDPKHHYTAMRAAQVLAEIGDNGIPPLLQALAQPGHHAAQPTMCALFWTPPTGTNAAQAVPLLVGYIRDPDFMVAQAAADALGAIHTDPDMSLPALTSALTSSEPAVRQAAAGSIGKFGTNALRVLSDLMPALADPSPDVRATASNAVAAISPEALAPPAHTSRPL